MDEINGTEPAETPDNVLVPEIIEGEVVEDVQDVSGENLPEETGDLIEDAVRFINFTTKKMVRDYALKIGNYLLTRFFNDDIGLASSKSPFKNVSFAQLCRRPDISLTRQDLGDVVRISAQARVFRSIGVDITVLTYTHQRYLAQLPHSEVKLDLVMESIAQGLPSRDVYLRIQGIKRLPLLPEPDPAQAQGRLITQYSGALTRLVDKAAMPEMFTDPEQLKGMAPENRARLKETAAEWIAGLDKKRFEYQLLIHRIEEMDTPEMDTAGEA
jgi:hypothetical protein